MNHKFSTWAPYSVCVFGSIVLATSAWAKTIPIVVDCPVPDPRPESPVRFGVPFPRGELQTNDIANLRVIDGDGNVVPFQARTTATWNADGSDGVRWLLVDTLVNKDARYSIQFNEPNPLPALSLPNVATHTNDQIQIDTGPIKGFVSAKGGHLFDSLVAMGMPVAMKPEGNGPLDFNGLYVEHEKKGIFRADLDPNATVVLEESGPVRATLKADGWYGNAQGEKFCRYSLRMHFFHGRQDIKLEHTFIFTGVSAEDKIRSVSMQLHRVDAENGKRMRAAVGGEDLLVPELLQDVTGKGYFVQDQSERGRYDFVYSVNGLTHVKIADKGGGWLTTFITESMSVAIRDAWQQYPWEMEIDDGAVRVHLWPKHGRLLDTTWDGIWHFLTDPQKRFLAAGKPHTEKDLDAWIQRLRERTNATGAAKTHEVWLSFSGPQSPSFKNILHRTYGSLAREVAHPVLAHADLEWTCASRALDFLPQSPKNMAMFHDEENFLQSLFHMVQDARDANDWRGWWDWGGHHQFMTVGPHYPRTGTYADDAGQGAWHRARPKSHYGWGGLPWLQYMRTGQRDWLRYAQTYTLYSADRAHSHHDGNGRSNGSEYHYDNSEIHWMGGYQKNPGGDQIASNLQGKDDYVYQYWLTGDRRPLDVLKAWGELVLAKNAGGAKWGTWKPGFERGNDIRNAGMQLHRVMMLYQATWNPRYLELAKTIASAFLPLDTEAKVVAAEPNPPEGRFHAAEGWAYEGMWFYWNVTRDEQFKKVLLAFIERSIHYDGGFMGSYGVIRACTYGWQLTGDETYLNLARGACDELISRGVSLWSFHPGGKMNALPMPRFLGTMATAPKAWRDANLPTHERGRQMFYLYHTFNNSPHMVGTRAFFQEKTERDWSFDASFAFGGRFAVIRPDGKVAVEANVDLATNKLARFDVPRDGLTGTYMLVCTEPSKECIENKNPEYPALARVFRSDLPMVIRAAVRPQMNNAMARELFFGVPAKAADASVYLADLDRKREYVLQQVGGSWQASTREMVPDVAGSFMLAIPSSDTDRIFELRFVTAPDAHFDPRESRPRYVLLQNVPPFLAANPEDWFEPTIAGTLQDR